VSIADRLSQLSEAQQTWTSKVESKDMKQFTVDDKLDRCPGILLAFYAPAILHDMSVLAIHRTMQINSLPTEIIIYFWKQSGD